MNAVPALIPARQKDVNRAKVCDDNFIEFVNDWQGEVLPKPTPDEPILDGSACSAEDFDALFRSQLISRHLDLMARVEIPMRDCTGRGPDADRREPLEDVAARKAT